MKRTRTYSRVTHHALSILGKSIRLGRIERSMTAQDLANRAGISRATLHNIESGKPGSEIGIVFEVAALTGVPLFADDDRTLATHQARLDEKLTLLPARVRPSGHEVDDDF